MKKDKLREERLRLIAFFESKVIELECERNKHLRGLSTCGHQYGEVIDEGDAAHDELARAGVCGMISRYNEMITRTNVIINFLRGGWDVSCIECGNSVLERLNAGIPTQRCFSCENAREQQAAARYGRARRVPVLART